MQMVFFSSLVVVPSLYLQSREFLYADNLFKMAQMGRRHFVCTKHIMEEFKVIKLQSMYF